ncbi:hypothetical protein CSA17_06335 [bacterium DOLJORAL78_65_58]|nr:MAG: hypothetical protein CSB20_06145 [bacterium DOLZORAL124_64_63]PIE75652.1 MAG: hypothetical protein CSA17_06335 [bacterium DOLJORAL78_65_58]
MKIMVLTPYLPHRQVGHGGGTAVRDLVTQLARRHQVLVASFLRPGEEERVADVQALGAQVASLPFADHSARGLARLGLWRSRLGSGLRSLRTGFPPYVEKYWSPALRDRFLRLVQEFQPDAVQIEYLQLSLYARDLRRRRRAQGRSSPRIILNTHELGSVPRLRRARRAGHPLSRQLHLAEARRWRHLQQEACRWADRTLCVTDEDRALYEQQGGRNLLTVPLGMDLEAIRPDRAPQGRDCLFVGSFGHRPNVLAARLLTREIWPLVLRRCPAARLILAGRGSREFLAAESAPAHGIEARGFVEDLGPLFRTSRLFVAPLPEGGGIKIKILEALARGIPVLTTPVGAEGIAGAADGVMTITAADRTFADAILDALDDPQAEERAARARRHMEEKFGWEAIANRLAGIYAGQE